MSQDHHQAFIRSLVELNERDPGGAMAALRRSLAFEPGDDPKTYPYVERYVPRDMHGNHPLRKAMYAVAGLFALHPEAAPRPLAAVYGKLVRDLDRPSLEQRFIALLDADPESVVTHLRQIVRLLKANDRSYDHVALLNDLRWLLDDHFGAEARDRVRRDWARQFYGAVQANDLQDRTADLPADQ